MAMSLSRAMVYVPAANLSPSNGLSPFKTGDPGLVPHCDQSAAKPGFSAIAGEPADSSRLITSATSAQRVVSRKEALTKMGGTRWEAFQHSWQMSSRQDLWALDGDRGCRSRLAVASWQAKSGPSSVWRCQEVQSISNGLGGSIGPMGSLHCAARTNQSSSLAFSRTAMMGSAVFQDHLLQVSSQSGADSSAGSSGNGVRPRATANTGTEPPESTREEAVPSLWGHLGHALIGHQGAATTAAATTAVGATVAAGVVIHPTAVVHPDAILMEGVEVGPLCTVGPGAQLGPGCKLHAGSHVAGDTELGARCILYSGAVVGADIPGRTVLGSDNKIGYHAVVGVQCQDMKYKEGSPCHLVMGDGNDVREHASIHRSSMPEDKTVIGDRNLIMGSCHVAHDCKLGHRNILANGTLLAGHVVVEDFVHTGGAVAVHQFCHIGAYSFLAGGSMVARDVPTYTMVAGDRAELRGLNLEGMRRCGFTDAQVRGIRKVYQKLFLSTDVSLGLEDRLTVLEADVDAVADPVVLRLIVSVRLSFGENRRGICKFRHWVTADQ